MGVALEYELTGSGWAKCTLRIDAAMAETASYLGDARGDLVSAVTAALRGHPKAVASFCEEPGEYRWILEACPPGQVRIRILEFTELWGDRPDADGRVILDAECPLRELAQATLACLRKLEQRYGMAGYRERWGAHNFPEEQAAELEKLLGQRSFE